MIRSSVKLFDRFPEITARVERAAQQGLDRAASAAADAAQGGASIDLELEVKAAHGDLEGYSAGIKANKRSRNTRRATPIAGFFDQGTLGKRRKPPKRPRRSSWTVNRGDSTYVAHRGDVDGKGIEPEGFFARARTAGRKALLETIERELP